MKILVTALILIGSLCVAYSKPPFQGVVTATLQPSWFNVARKPELEDFLGRRTVLYFWTTSCSTCIPVWRQLERAASRPNAPYQLIGVHAGRFTAEHNLEFVRATVRRFGLKFPIVDDAGFTLRRVFGVTSWPTLVVINPEGHVQKSYSNVASLDELDQDLAKMDERSHFVSKASAIPLRPEPKVTSPSPLRYPSRITVADRFEGGPALVVSDSGNHRIVVMRPNGTLLYTIGSGLPALKDGTYETASFQMPSGMTVRENAIYVADTGNNAIRKIDLKKRTVETIAGNGSGAASKVLMSSPALSTAVPSPMDLAFYPNDEELAIAVGGANQIWGYRPHTKVLRTVAGGSVEGRDDGMNARVTLAQPNALFPSGGQLFFIDAISSSLRYMEKGRVTTLIGKELLAHGFENGSPAEALMQYPTAMWVDSDKIYIADSYNHAIRVFNRSENVLNSIAGRKPGMTNGAFLQAQFDNPTGIARFEDNLYVCDSNNHSIRVLNMKRREVSTLNLVPASVAPRQAASVWEVTPKKDWKVALELEDGWKLQTKKGSRFILTQEAKPRPITIYRAQAKELDQTSFVLPPLKADGQYRLQATFYFCSAGKDSLCTTQSVDSIVVPNQSGQNRFTIALKP